MHARVKVAVFYDGEAEQVHHLALAATDGARSAGGDVRMRRIGRLVPADAGLPPPETVRSLHDVGRSAEASPADLAWADVALFGAATPYGVALDGLTRFIDATVPLWRAGRLGEKVYGAVSAAAAVHGGPDRRMVSLVDVFHHWGGIVVPLAGRDPIRRRVRAPDGASAATQGSRFEHELAAARSLGRRATETARALKAGRRLLVHVA